MKLTVSKRSSDKKCEAKRLRRKGDIPAVIYSKGEKGEEITVDGAEFSQIMSNLKRGHLPTTIFSLVDSDGKERRAIVKDIQYHVTTYNVLHLDFEELHDDIAVNIKVPIEFLGEADCKGVKLGGVLRRVITHLRVRCLPGKIPTSFGVDVSSLEMKDTKRLRDIVVPEGVRPMANMDEVVVVVAKR